jgi:hypothetical protein
MDLKYDLNFHLDGSLVLRNWGPETGGGETKNQVWEDENEVRILVMQANTAWRGGRSTAQSD